MRKFNSETVKEENEVNLYEMYLNDVKRYESLDEAKTRHYIDIYKTSTDALEKKEAKDHIVTSQQRLVCSIANKFVNDERLIDLISEGNIGLMVAIDEFDPTVDTKFSTYATYWIRKYIIDYLSTIDPMMVPANISKISTYLPKIKKDFWVENERQPTVDELKEIFLEKYNLNISNDEDLLTFQPTSIDEKYVIDDEGSEMMENTAYTSRTATCNVEDDIAQMDIKETANRILAKMSDRDANIIKSFYGIGCDAMSLDTIAMQMGMSYERVRQIAAKKIEELGKENGNFRYAF